MNQDDAVQTRSETNGLKYFETVEAAFKAASEDETIWKISFNVKEERVRLVRDENGWIFSAIKLE